MILPYVYKLTHKSTSQFYIGYRSANKVYPELDIGFKYFSSSKLVKALGFENFDIEVIAVFFKSDDALEFEQGLIKENFDNPLKLNLKYYYDKVKKFDTTGRKLTLEHKSKISRRNTGRIMKPEVRKNLSNNRMGNRNPFYGKKHSKESKEKISKRDYSMVSGINNIHSKQVIVNGVLFDTVREASKFLNIHDNTLRDYLKGRTKLPDKIWQAEYHK